MEVIDIEYCIYIVIVNFNGSKDTLECIKSIKKINYKNYKILVIDNNSNEYNKKLLYSLESDVKLIINEDNLGFSKANNIGINHSLRHGADFVLLLNNDTIVTSDFLKEALKSFELGIDIGIVGGKIYYFDNPKETWYDGAKIDWIKFCGKKSSGININDKEAVVSLISGCMMLIKKDVFYNVGLLPEEYFMYYEDIDFCAMVINNGYKLVYNSKSIIYHKVSKSSGGEESPFLIKYCTRNWKIFMNKYSYKTNSFVYCISTLYYYFNRYCHYILYLIHNDNYRSKAIIDGINQAKIFINK